MNAAEDDDVGGGVLSALGEGKAVANIVGYFLNLVALVVVAKNDGVFLFL